MLDRLIDLVVNFIGLFQFWVIVYEYERGVVLRLGRYKRVLEPGFHWCWPFHIDYVMVDNVVNRVIELGAQSLTTKDGHDVTVNAVVTASICDIRRALLDVEDVDHAVTDACCATVGEHVNETTWDELRTELAAEELKKACYLNALRYGIEIQRVQLKDLTRCRSLRILTASRDEALKVFKNRVRLG